MESSDQIGRTDELKYRLDDGCVFARGSTYKLPETASENRRGERILRSVRA